MAARSLPSSLPTDASVAVERDFVAAWWLIAEHGGHELHSADGLRWFHSGLGEKYLNAVMETHLDGASAEARIVDLVAELRGRGVPFLWWVLPSSRPDNLAAILGSLGLVADDAWPGMIVPVAELVAPPGVEGLAIRRVVDEAAYDEYESVFAPHLSPSQAFTDALAAAARSIGFADDAPEVHFVGYLRDEPVATTSLITAGGAAGIYNVVTAEHARRRGIGAALTAHAIRVGAERGVEVATLQASTMGRPVYERMGFRFACDLVPFQGMGGES
jgi:ribosomal protein S18 acetylase RimI-like enzyme